MLPVKLVTSIIVIPRQLGIQLPGGFADYCIVPDSKYVLDYTGIRPGLAATYMCSGLTAFGALKT